MVLEHGMQADDGDLALVEHLGDPPGLREAMRDAAGAQHLEGHDDHDLALEAVERRRRLGVEPLRDLKLGRALGVEHQMTFPGSLRRP